jgi:hypothetical protein
MPPDDRVEKINRAIQIRLKKLNLRGCTPIAASAWLETAGLLPPDESRPGRPLRVLLRRGLIKGAKQDTTSSKWEIRRI